MVVLLFSAACDLPASDPMDGGTGSQVGSDSGVGETSDETACMFQLEYYCYGLSMAEESFDTAGTCDTDLWLDDVLPPELEYSEHDRCTASDGQQLDVLRTYTMDSLSEYYFDASGLLYAVRAGVDFVVCAGGQLTVSWGPDPGCTDWCVVGRPSVFSDFPPCTQKGWSPTPWRRP
jgi:hypothetical protein